MNEKRHFKKTHQTNSMPPLLLPPPPPPPPPPPQLSSARPSGARTLSEHSQKAKYVHCNHDVQNAQTLSLLRHVEASNVANARLQRLASCSTRPPLHVSVACSTLSADHRCTSKTRRRSFGCRSCLLSHFLLGALVCACFCFCAAL